MYAEGGMNEERYVSQLSYFIVYEVLTLGFIFAL